jgi:hypothetical protein
MGITKDPFQLSTKFDTLKEKPNDINSLMSNKNNSMTLEEQTKKESCKAV